MAFQPTRFVLMRYYYATTRALTSHFHPYLVKDMAVIFCDTKLYRTQVRSHLLDGVVLYVVRTFLFRFTPKATERYIMHKGSY